MRLHPVALTLAALATAAPAHAHPGDHGGVDPIAHALGSPDHLLPLVLAAGLAAALWGWSRR